MSKLSFLIRVGVSTIYKLSLATSLGRRHLAAQPVRRTLCDNTRISAFLSYALTNENFIMKIAVHMY